MYSITRSRLASCSNCAATLRLIDRRQGEGAGSFRYSSKSTTSPDRRVYRPREEQEAGPSNGPIRNWRERENGGGRESHQDQSPPRSWAPTKKLTYAAMAGMRALHQSDPKLYNRAALGEKFGVSYDAVGRILRSRFEHKAQEGLSPVPAIQKVIAQKRQKYNST